MRAFNRLSALFLAGSITFLMAGCQKENDLANPKDVSTSEVQPEYLFCNLTNVSGTSYVAVSQTLFGTHGTTNAGNIDNYYNCNYPATAVDNCCSPVVVYLNGLDGVAGTYSTSPAVSYFEGWGVGYGGTDEPLSDGVITAAEQQAFIDRAIDYAEGISLPCSGGQMIPVHYDFSFDFIPNGTNNASPIVKVTYAPICYMFF